MPASGTSGRPAQPGAPQQLPSTQSAKSGTTIYDLFIRLCQYGAYVVALATVFGTAWAVYAWSTAQSSADLANTISIWADEDHFRSLCSDHLNGTAHHLFADKVKQCLESKSTSPRQHLGKRGLVAHCQGTAKFLYHAVAAQPPGFRLLRVLSWLAVLLAVFGLLELAFDLWAAAHPPKFTAKALLHRPPGYCEAFSPPAPSLEKIWKLPVFAVALVLLVFVCGKLVDWLQGNVHGPIIRWRFRKSLRPLKDTCVIFVIDHSASMLRHRHELETLLDALVVVRRALPSSTMPSVFTSETTLPTDGWPYISPELLPHYQKLSQPSWIGRSKDLLDAISKSISYYRHAAGYCRAQYTKSEHSIPFDEATKGNDARSEDSTDPICNKDGEPRPCLLLVLTDGTPTVLQDASKAAERLSGVIKGATPAQLRISFIQFGPHRSSSLEALTRHCNHLNGLEAGSTLANLLFADGDILEMLLGPTESPLGGIYGGRIQPIEQSLGDKSMHPVPRPGPEASLEEEEWWDRLPRREREPHVNFGRGVDVRLHAAKATYSLGRAWADWGERNGSELRHRK